MTNQEINEYLAERIFGLEIENHKIVRDGECQPDDCIDCAYSDGLKCPNRFTQYVPDYIKDYQQVLEWLAIRMDDMQYSLSIDYSVYDKVFYAYVTQPFNDYEPILCRGEGKELGEAVCRAAIEWLEVRIK